MAGYYNLPLASPSVRAVVNQTIMLSFAILFCAMILDRIVQGGKQ